MQTYLNASNIVTHRACSVITLLVAKIESDQALLLALQRYTIRDLNTGQLYVLDGDGDGASPNDPAMPASGLVTDVIQGRQLSLDEFEQVLGLNAVLEVCHSLSQCITAYFSISQHVTAHLLAITLIVSMLVTKKRDLLASAEPLLPSWNKVAVAKPRQSCLPELHCNAAMPT